MKRRWVVAVLVIAASVIMAGVVFGGAVEYFLKIDDVKGESMDAKHKGEIEVLSWSWGESATGTDAARGAATAGKGYSPGVMFTTYVNKASVIFFQARATGKHFKQAILTGRKAGKAGQDYYKVTFTDVVVSSYQTGGSTQSNTLPADQFTFNFAGINIWYAPQRPDGSLEAPVTAGYNTGR
jgi:type VI secretion system secreted protein Hcp